MVGHVLTTGVILDLWDDHDPDLGEIMVAMTAAGIGHAWVKGMMVDNVLGIVSPEMVVSLREEFARSFIETNGDPTDLRD